MFGQLRTINVYSNRRYLTLSNFHSNNGCFINVQLINGNRNPSLEDPVATQCNFPLAICDVDHLFLYHKCNKTVPFRPKGGEVYVFRPDNQAEINDWVSDVHVFSCEGTRKIKGRIGENECPSVKAFKNSKMSGM